MKKSCVNETMRLILLSLLFVGQLVKAQSFVFPKLADQGNEIQKLVPANWKAIDTVFGDLNNDHRNDLVLVLEYHESVAERRAYGDNDTDLIKEFQRPRMLAIYFKNKQQGYHIALQNNNFILRSQEGGAFGEPFQSANIKNNQLILDFMGGASWRWKLHYQFKFEDGQWILKAAKNTSYNVVSGEMNDKKYDFVGKKVKETVGNMFDASVNTEQEKSLPVAQLKTLANFKKPWTWEILKDNFL